MPKKSNFQKAAEGICEWRNVVGSPAETATLPASPGTIWFVSNEGANIIASRPGDDPGQERMGPLDTEPVGEIQKFIIQTEELWRMGQEGRPMQEMPPTDLAGSASGKGSRNFEALVTTAGLRLEKDGVATVGRYPVASVIMKGSPIPRQVPSLPDFEGVNADGRQFIWEAKVCSQPAFRIVKDKIKHKQVQHMLRRSDFNVPCHLIIHFNERLGKTFFEPAFTVAVPVTRARKGGWEVWEQFAAEKDKTKEFPSITRDLARKLGKPIRWWTPPLCKNSYPFLEDLLEAP